MKSLSVVLAITFFANVSFADCDYSKEIERTADGRYSYSKECHKAVGAALQNLESREEQVVELKKQLVLKDFLIIKEKDRAELWLKTSTNLDKKVSDLERLEQTNKWLYFGLGVLATGLAVYGAGQLNK